MVCDKYDPSQMTYSIPLPALSPGLIEKVTTELSTSIYQLIDIHCSSFYADFQPLHAPLYRVSCENLGVPSHLSFTVYAAHNIPETWVHRWVMMPFPQKG